MGLSDFSIARTFRVLERHQDMNSLGLIALSLSRPSQSLKTSTSREPTGALRLMQI